MSGAVQPATMHAAKVVGKPLAGARRGYSSRRTSRYTFQRMFSHQFYNVVHIVGIVLLMTALGGLALHATNGGTRQSNAAHRLIASLHGTGVLLVLIGGFGMLARLGFRHGVSFPGWLWVKLAVWLLLGAALVLPYRRPALAKPLLLALPVLGGLAAYMAIYKPL